MDYAFDPTTAQAYAEMKRRREIANQLAGTIGNPRDVGEGLNAIGSALMARAQERKADKARNQIASMPNVSQEMLRSLYGIPQYRLGTAYHPGGPAIVGEDGPEIAMLPPGAAVIPNPATQEQSRFLDDQAYQVAQANTGTMTDAAPTFAERARDANLDLNVTQAQRAGQALRLLQAESILRELEGQGTRTGQKALEWLFPGGLENMAVDEDYGRFQQARDAFAEAAMRADTGATINESEWPRIMRNLMPQPGDGPERLAQRRAMREVFIQSLMASSGDAQALMPEIGQPVVPIQNVNPQEMSDEDLLRALSGG